MIPKEEIPTLIWQKKSWIGTFFSLESGLLNTINYFKKLNEIN